MPELPEVETIRRGLEKNIRNKKISKVAVINKKSIHGSLDNFIKILKGNFFSDFTRFGKLLVITLRDKNSFLLIHLKMTGQLIYSDGENIVAGGHKLADEDIKVPNKYTRAVISFQDKTNLYFNDLRKFGWLKIVDKQEKDKIKLKYGVEPLSKNFTFDYFKKITDNKRTSIKAMLLKQELIAGIGNIYADEVCFAAKVLPDRQANTLNAKELRNIYLIIKQILAKAVKYGGTTFRDFLDNSGQKGNYSNQLKVYGRAKQKCLRCNGVIMKKKVAGRGTCYCKNCQK